jgi:hypothetical protein
MTRRANDAYETGAWQVRALLAHQPVSGVILEPCSGDGSIVRVLSEYAAAHPDRGIVIVTNDLDPTMPAHFHLDASKDDVYREVIAAHGRIDWIITNPPYTMPTCTEIVARSVAFAQLGVAMNLRISFREPPKNPEGRGPWLAANPIDRVLTMPRYSYTGNGRSDSATTEWDVWLKDAYLPELAPRPILTLYNAHEIYAESAK